MNMGHFRLGKGLLVAIVVEGDVSVLLVAGGQLGNNKWLTAVAHNNNSKIRGRAGVGLVANCRSGVSMVPFGVVGGGRWWGWVAVEEHSNSNHSDSSRDGERERRNGEFVFLFLYENDEGS